MRGASVTDALVVGGGAAGCVLAAWLSEDPGCEVTLLEVAPDLVGVAALPADVVDASGPILAHDWAIRGAGPTGVVYRVARRQARRGMLGDQRVLRPAEGRAYYWP